MTACRAELRRRLIAGLAVVAALIGPDLASAQTRGPILLGPPTPPSPPGAASPPAQGQAAPSSPPLLSPPPSSNAPAVRPAPEPEAPRATADGSIRIDSLTRLTVDAVGTLPPQSGGLRSDLWNGTPGPVALRLISLLPSEPDSRALRDVQRRLLLSSGPAPSGLPKDGALLAARAERLLAMGALDDLGALAAAAPSRAPDSAMARVLTDRAFALGDDEAACTQVDAFAPGSDDRYWVKAGMVCELVRGNAAKAEFGARLLVELGHDDPLLQELVQGAVAGWRGGPHRIPEATPVHLAAARAGKIPIDPDVFSITSLPTLVALARGVGSPPFAARLAAAERAERAGAIPPEALTALYADVAVQAGSMNSAFRLAEADPGPYARALLWRTAEAQFDPNARARVIQKAFEVAEEPSGWRLTARLFAPLIRQLDPASATEAFAGEAVRALVAAGDPAGMRPWLESLRARAQAGSPAAVTALRRLWPVAWIGGGDTLMPYDPAAVSAWWDDLRASEPEEASVRGAAALALMEAVGAPIGVDAWRGLAAQPATALYEAPTAAFRNGVAAGAEAGRLAEVVALACAGFGEVPLDELDPTAVAGVVAALTRVGLEADARRLAGEAAIAYGL